MVGATEHAAKALQTAVNVAQNLRSAKDRRKKFIRALSKSAYGMVWRAVEREFFSALAEVPSLWSDDSDDPTRTIRERFYVHLRRATYSALNATCPDENLSPRDVTNAHQQLRRALQSKGMAKMLSLPTGRAA